MTYKEEINRVVLTHLLNKYHPSVELTERHWDIAYKIIRADNIIKTITWKLENIGTAR